MVRRFILLKDSPELKKGAVLEEDCDSGDQDFHCITKEKHQKFSDQHGTSYSRFTVLKNPEWFQEVENLWLTKEQLKKIKKVIKI